jgi:hypothetical protein
VNERLSLARDQLVPVAGFATRLGGFVLFFAGLMIVADVMYFRGPGGPEAHDIGISIANGGSIPVPWPVPLFLWPLQIVSIRAGWLAMVDAPGIMAPVATAIWTAVGVVAWVLSGVPDATFWSLAVLALFLWDRRPAGPWVWNPIRRQAKS